MVHSTPYLSPILVEVELLPINGIQILQMQTQVEPQFQMPTPPHTPFQQPYPQPLEIITITAPSISEQEVVVHLSHQQLQR